MARPVDFTTDLLSLATLFGGCLDGFDAYKGAQEYERDVNIVLVQLDFEKSRLLKWAEQVGLVEVSNKQHDVSLERLLEPTIRKVLEEIEELLNGTEQAQSMFGFRPREELDIPPPPYALDLGPDMDFVSRNSMIVFGMNYRRLHAKYDTPLPRRGVLSRTRWFIHDCPKFVGFINALKDYIDRLYSLLELEKSVQEEAIRIDIMESNNLLELQLVEEAAEASSYPAFATAATVAIDRTESATLDRRTIADGQTPSPPGTSQKPVQSRFDSQPSDRTIFSRGSTTKAFFMVTPPCPSYSDSCTNEDFLHWPYRLGYEHIWDAYPKDSNSIALRMIHRIDLSIALMLENFPDHLSNAKKLSEFGDPYPVEPLAAVVVHVAPCLRLISTANSFWNSATGGKARLLRYHIRVDDRLKCSCSDSAGNQSRLKALVSRRQDSPVAEWQLLLSRLDLTWMEQRVYELELDRPLISSSGKLDSIFDRSTCQIDEDEPVAAILVIGEDTEVISMFQELPLLRESRMPAPGNFFGVISTTRPAGREWRRQFLGTYKLNDKLVPRSPAASLTRSEDPASLVKESRSGTLKTLEKRRMSTQSSQAASEHSEKRPRSDVYTVGQLKSGPTLFEIAHLSPKR